MAEQNYRTINGASQQTLTENQTLTQQLPLLLSYNHIFNIGIIYSGNPTFLYNLGFKKVAPNKYLRERK